MTEEAEAILRPLRGVAGYVFRNCQGKRYVRQTLRLILNRACDKAGVGRVKIHEFARHSKGGQLINAGYTLEEIAAVFGHKTTVTTQRYCKLQQDRLKEMGG